MKTEAISVSFLCSLLHITNIFCNFDPCIQPIGMENGIINDSEITIDPSNVNISSIRLHSSPINQTEIKSVTVDLGRIMTIKGFGFQCNSNFSITLRYGIKPSDDIDDELGRIKISEKNNQNDRVFKCRRSNGELQHLFFENDTISLRFIKLSIKKQNKSFKFEMYGCADVCSSLLNSSSMYQPNNVSNNANISWCLSDSRMKTIYMSTAMTISGIHIQLETRDVVKLNVKCKRNGDVQGNFNINTLSTQNMTFWLPDNQTCDTVDFKDLSSHQKCITIIFIGCKNGCMNHIKAASDQLSASSKFNDSDNFGGKQSFLYNRNSTWLRKDNDKNQWVRICFENSVYVSAIAIQAQGYTNYEYVKTYNITAGENEEPLLHYKTDSKITTFSSGISGRYATFIVPFPETFVAKCIQINPVEVETVATLRWGIVGCVTSAKPIIIKTSTSKWVCSSTLQNLVWKLNTTVIKSDETFQTNGTTQTDKIGNERKISTLTINNPSIWIKRHGTLVYDESRKTYMLHATLTCSVDEYADHANFAVDIKIGGVCDVNDIDVNATNTTAVITWLLSPDNNTNSSVIFYSHIIDISHEKKTGKIYKATAKQVTVKGLHPFRNYKVKIFAFNFNTSQVKSCEKCFKTKEGAPSAVTNLNASALTDTEIEVNWGKPEEENGVLSSYFIKLPNVTQKEINHNNKSLYYQRIRLLKAYTNYTIKVQASTNNDNILGQPATITVRTKEGKSSRPRNLSSEVTNNNSIIIRWDKPLNENGKILKYAISYNGTKDYYDGFKDVNSMSTTGKEKILTDLFPGTNYTFYVQAVNGAGGGEAETTSVKVPNGKPRKPKIRASEDLSTGYKVILWENQPDTGPIMYYTITITSNDYKKCVNVTFNSLLEKYVVIIIKHGIKLVTLGNTNLNLPLIGNITFCYVAVVEDDNCSNNGVLQGEPSTTIVERRDLKPPKTISKTATSVTISIPQGPGCVIYYVIIVVPGNANISAIKTSALNNFTNSTTPYITGVFSKNQSIKIFTIGDGKSYYFTENNQQNRREILNVPLHLNTRYFIGARAHVDDDNFYTGWLEVQNTDQTNVETKDNTTTIAVVVVVVLVVVLVGTVVPFAFVRRWRTKRKILEGSRNVYRVSGLNIGLEEIDTSNEEPSPELTIGSSHPPIEISSFQKVWKNLKKDSYLNLSKEYDDLNSGQLHQWTDALIAENKSKNRYANIVAYNHSRVRLLHQNPNRTDYINASYIHGYSEDNLYIASQGPNAETVNDFWQMIWENHVFVIVMVTNLIEKKKIKCEQYWPEKGKKTFGKYEVHLDFVDTFTDFVVRNFSVKGFLLIFNPTIQFSNHSKKRIIHQYHFVSWPDHGVPDSPSDLLSFHRKFRRDYPFENTSYPYPILVHCSAGVGRTGTFICIDNMLKLAEEKNIIDVFNFVNFMRTRRIHMVQSVEQYMFIYQALFESLMCGNTSIEISQFIQENKILKRPQLQGNNKNGYQLQFELLNTINDSLLHNQLVSGMKEINLPMNRSNILSREHSRVTMTSSVDDETMDYINAVFVNDYRKKNAFIATQYPLANTVQDFWRMILQKKIVTVVMLNSIYEMGEIYESFWPSQSEVCNYNNITVMSKDEKITNNITTKTFAVMNNKEDTVVTSFIFFDKWTESNIPQNLCEIVDLFSVVERTQGINDVTPVVVICSDGSCRCGAYIAMSILMEQLITEESIDVFQTVRKIRIKRSEFIQSMEQYEMLYKIAQHFIESFSTYSNFSG